MNLVSTLLEEGLKNDPQRPALEVFGPQGRTLSLSFEVIGQRIGQAATALRSFGLRRGERVALNLGDRVETPLCFFGAIAAGLIPVPLSTQLSNRERDYIIADCGTKALLEADESGSIFDNLSKQHIPDIEASEPSSPVLMSPEDPAFLVFTSGTSGRPKGVLHAHRTIEGRRPMRAGWTGLIRQDRLLHAGAYNWTYTLGVGLMDCWTAGGCAVRCEKASMAPSDWPTLIETSGATIFAAVPSLYRRMLKYGEVSHHWAPDLRHVLSAGEALPADLTELWTKKTKRPIYEALGMSELSTYISAGPGMSTRPGSPGKPQVGRRVVLLPDDEGTEPVRTGDIGVISVHRSDPGLFLGYWGEIGEPGGSYRGDWFITGDRARFDEDGYLWYEGRTDDQMSIFGYRVAPEEVEAAFASIETVDEVAASSLCTDDGKSLIVLYIVTQTSLRELEPRLRSRAIDQLAVYKRPHLIRRIGETPRAASGKLLRRRLVDVPVLETIG